VTSAQPASDSPLYGLLPYPPFLVTLPSLAQQNVPDLLIEGYVGGRQVTEVRMSSDPLGDSLSMTADGATILADGSDATRVVFRAVDTYGNQRRYMTGNVTMNLSGPAVLIGDNPFAFGEYGGLGAVWIRSLAGQQGTITLAATHPLLGHAQVKVRAQAVSQASVLA